MPTAVLINEIIAVIVFVSGNAVNHSNVIVINLLVAAVFKFVAFSGRYYNMIKKVLRSLQDDPFIMQIRRFL